MKLSGMFVRAVLIAAAGVALAGCGQYGLKGDKGLPPAPDSLAYPRVYTEPGMDPHRRLKSPEEQARLQADIQARKPMRRATR